MIQDSRRIPPQDRYGVPQRQYPTPNILDAVFVEEVPRKKPYVVLLPGTPHPDYPERLLVWVGPMRGDNNEIALHYVYCSTRNAQDAYNASISYTEGNNAYPVFTRTYFEPRKLFAGLTGFSPLAAGSTLDSVIGLELVTSGSVSATPTDQRLDLTFTGGAGTGAKGIAQVHKGRIVSVLLTNGGGTRNGGSAYTSAPTVSVAGVTGESITAFIQPTTCKLTRQLVVPAEGEFESLFVQVTRVYETLPGPEMAEPHYDTATGTEQTTYRQRVAAGTLANPVAAVQIASASVASPTVVSTLSPHGLPLTGTSQVRIAGVTGGTSIAGERTATRTGTNTFTIPVNVTVAPDANTGYMSPLKTANGPVIIDSYVKLDDGAGAAAGTLITVCATLPGREFGCPQYDVERGATVDTLRQAVHFGFGTKTEGATYHGQTVEDSQFIPQGTAFGMLVSKTILLPGNPIPAPSFNDENGGVLKLFQTRVALASALDDIGTLYSSTPDRYVEESKIIPENTVVGVLTTLTSTIPDSFTTVVSHNEPMPRIFTFLGGWTIPNPPFNTVGPYLGVDYEIRVHSPAGPADCIKTFTLHRDTDPMDPIFSVNSGQSPRLPINGLTLHDAYLLTETAPGPVSQDIEAMLVSDPPPGDYVTGDPLVVNVTERPLRHPDGIWIRETYTVLAT